VAAKGADDLGTRIGIAVMGRVSAWSFGHRSPVVEEFVRTFGLRHAVRYMRDIGAVTDGLTARYGPVTSQTLQSIGAMWNGCLYCARGHLYTANLYCLRDTGALFPLDERDLGAWFRTDEDALLGALLDQLEGAAFGELRGALDRQHQLRDGPLDPATPDDDLLLGLHHAWALVNECSITVSLDLEMHAHTREMERDRALKRRYAELRAAERARGEPDTRYPV
jgi:hypothetical protein